MEDSNKKIIVQIYMSKKDRKRIKRCAELEGETMSSFIRKRIMNYVNTRVGDI